MNIFAYIISLGASVMMPIIFTLLGILLKIKPGKALLSGLYVGVGFVGLSVVTGLLTSALGPALETVVGVYGLQLDIFDMGWPAAAAVAYNTAVGALIIPVCLGVNMLMLLTRTTRTVNIDLWNYWHYAFIGAIVYFATDSLAYGFAAAIFCFIVTLVMADRTADGFQSYYDGMDGISIPQPFCQSFVPFAVVLGKVFDRIPGFDRLDVDADGLKRRFGILGEPLFLGVIVGCAIGVLARYDVAATLLLGVKMGAVMELIPRITRLFIDGLIPISEATKQMISRRFGEKARLHIGMSPALVIGHPTTLVVSLLLIPVVLLLAVVLPGNKFLPLASLAGLFYLFPVVLPITRGNVLKTFLIGLVALVVGLYFATNIAEAFTVAANSVAQIHPEDASVRIPEGFSAGAALDFASSLFCWATYHLFTTLRYVGIAAAALCTGVLVLLNYKKINNNV